MLFLCLTSCLAQASLCSLMHIRQKHTRRIFSAEQSGPLLLECFALVKSQASSRMAAIISGGCKAAGTQRNHGG